MNQSEAGFVDKRLFLVNCRQVCYVTSELMNCPASYGIEYPRV